MQPGISSITSMCFCLFLGIPKSPARSSRAVTHVYARPFITPFAWLYSVMLTTHHHLVLRVRPPLTNKISLQLMDPLRSPHVSINFSEGPHDYLKPGSRTSVPSSNQLWIQHSFCITPQTLEIPRHSLRAGNRNYEGLRLHRRSRFGLCCCSTECLCFCCGGNPKLCCELSYFAFPLNFN
jgi:hypothetical protein